VVPLGRPRLKWGIILKLLFKKSLGGGGGMDWSVSGLGQAGGSFESGDVHSGSVKLAKFLDWVRNY
jgi:hypothetical protein